MALTRDRNSCDFSLNNYSYSPVEDDINLAINISEDGFNQMFPAALGVFIIVLVQDLGLNNWVDGFDWNMVLDKLLYFGVSSLIQLEKTPELMVTAAINEDGF